MRFLLIIPHIAVYIAILAWLITFVAMLFDLGNLYLSSRRQRLRPRHQQANERLCFKIQRQR
jgi:hypothetical protein